MTDKDDESVKLEVFDPPMCCSSGVCGPKVDPKLLQFSVALEWLRSQGVQVERYNPSHQYDAFAGNATVVKAITDWGLDCLPLILVNGNIASRGLYPGKDKLSAMAVSSREARPGGSAASA
ncbi:MAG: arsenite efflux transporter metallochaperone ArsD [Verrucomicrobia bacterium]|nr:arsenite efflux transporter metallochaperone ArsD [Verrucomicrobiota bacterium]